jgi:hypothetical protein
LTNRPDDRVVAEQEAAYGAANSVSAEHELILGRCAIVKANADLAMCLAQVLNLDSHVDRNVARSVKQHGM